MVVVPPWISPSMSDFAMDYNLSIKPRSKRSGCYLGRTVPCYASPILAMLQSRMNARQWTTEGHQRIKLAESITYVHLQGREHPSCNGSVSLDCQSNSLYTTYGIGQDA